MKRSMFLAYAVLAILITGMYACSTKSKTSTCTVPASLSASAVTGTTATLNWSGASGATYTIQYRETGAAAWISSTSSTGTLTLTGLVPHATYEWQVKSNCTTSVSAFSASGTFTTTGCPAGYEGANCDVQANTKFSGVYNVTDSSFQGSSPTVFHYTMTVTAGTNPTDIMINNFGGFGQSTNITGTVSGKTMTIPNTVIVGYAITNASATVNNNVLTFTYTASDTISSAISRAVGVK